MEDCRTLRGLHKHIADLSAGKIVTIGKHEYFINDTNLKTKKGNCVCRVMQDNEPYAYMYYDDNSDSEIGMSSSWIVNYTIAN